jgi:hypothetical protein
MARKRKYTSSVVDLGMAEIEWDDNGLPILVLFGRWREHGQQRVRVKLGLGGAAEIARVLHVVPKRLQERVNYILTTLKEG